MRRYLAEVSASHAMAARRVDRSVREMYDQGRVSDVSAPMEFATSAVFTTSVVFLILLAL